MSILSDLWGDLRALFFPTAVSGVRPSAGRRHADRLHPLPYRGASDGVLAAVRQSARPLFLGIAARNARFSPALLFGRGGWRRLIHDFKYRGNWRLAREMGLWYGAELAECDWYRAVDVVVPVPLHWRKRLRRGYNQSEYLAEGIAAALGCEVDRRSVSRRRNNSSQTRHSHEERWENVAELFRVRRPERLRGRHILLVDDVLTTRATMVSCGEAILRAVPDCRISVAVLAASKRHLVHP